MSKRKKERVVYIPNQLYYTHTIYHDRGEQSYNKNKKLSEEYQRKLAKKRK